MLWQNQKTEQRGDEQIRDSKLILVIISQIKEKWEISPEAYTKKYQH
jgi:hypothetical protein